MTPAYEYEGLQQQAIQERLGFVDGAAPRHRPRRLAVLQGFSLHADTAVHGHDRQGLERLCRYGARGPVAESRLKSLGDGTFERSAAAVSVKAVPFFGECAASSRSSLQPGFTSPPSAPNARLRPLVTTAPAAAASALLSL